MTEERLKAGTGMAGNLAKGWSKTWNDGLLLAVAFCAIVGLTVSCFIANTARATVASYLMVTAVFLLPMFAFWAAGAQINERLASWFSFISPLAVSLSLLPDETGALDGLRDKYMLHLYLMGAICLLLLIVARMRLTALLRRG